LIIGDKERKRITGMKMQEEKAGLKKLRKNYEEN